MNQKKKLHPENWGVKFRVEKKSDCEKRIFVKKFEKTLKNWS